MNELERRRQRHRLIFRLACDFAGEQQQRRPEHLPAHRQQMRADLTNQRQVAGGDAGHGVGNFVELGAHWLLNRLQRRRALSRDVHSVMSFGNVRRGRERRVGLAARAHFEAALAICLSRLLTSRKSMSIANTRW